MNLNKKFEENWKKVSEKNNKIDTETDERIWDNLSREINQQKRVNTWWKVAALIIPLFGAIYYFVDFSKTEIKNELYFETTTNTKNFRLSDGSTIKLESNSTLVVHDNFGKKDRTITIAGKGYFDIAKDKTKPFNVITNGFKVQVLGTKFKLNYTKNENKVELIEGKVKIDFGDKTIVLLPNEIWLNNKNHQNYHYLKPIAKSSFVFENKNYNDVINELGLKYNMNIEYPKQFGKHKINGTFSGNLEEILTIISYPFDLKINKTEETKIILK